MNTRNYILTLITVVSLGSASLGASQFGKKAETFVQKGKEAYDHEQYVIAFDRFQKALDVESKETAQLEIKYLLGKTQMRLNHPKEAYLYFDELWKSGRKDSLFLREFGNSAIIVGNYDTAILVFNSLLQFNPQNKYYQNKLKTAKMALEKSKEPFLIQPSEIKVQSNVQSPFSEYGLSLKDGLLVYSSNAREESGLMDTRTAHGYSRLYSAHYNRATKEWVNPAPLGIKVSEEKSNIGAFSYDTARKIAYFMWYQKTHSGIYSSENRDGVWAEPELFRVNDIDTNVGHPAISPDGNRMLFIAKGNNGSGGSDIWIIERVPSKKTASTKKRTRPLTPAQQAAADKKRKEAQKKAEALRRKKEAEAEARRARSSSKKSKSSVAKERVPVIYQKEWGLPVRLDSLVNTSGQEVFPMWIDNNTFSFSSDGLPGYGGLDIYIAMLDSSGTKVNSVYLVDPPINSSFDDYNLLLDKGFQEGFFVSNRYTTPGRTDDILSFPKRNGKIKICGYVLDSVTKDTLTDYKITVKEINTSAPDVVMPNKKGEFCYESSKGMNYTLTIQKNGYTSDFQTITYPSIINTVPILLSLDQTFYITRDEKIEIPPVPIWDSITTDEDSPLLAEDASLDQKLSRLGADSNFLTLNDTAIQGAPFVIEDDPIVSPAPVAENAPVISAAPVAEPTVAENAPVVSSAPIAESAVAVGGLVVAAASIVGQAVLDDDPAVSAAPIVDPAVAESELVVSAAPIVEEELAFINMKQEQETEDILIHEEQGSYTGVDNVLSVGSSLETDEKSFVPIAIPIKDQGVQDLSKMISNDMSAKEIIDVISENRVDHPVVDQRFVNDYKKRINDPNRRSRLTVLPPNVECDACDEKTKQKKAGEPFFVRSNDDKALVTLKDNAGNVSYIDLAPNASYGIHVSQIPTGGNAPSLPDNIQISDLRKTVITKDYVMYECVPKLSEIDDEVYINNLYFEFDQANLINDAYRELDRMVIVAIKNPDMILEIESHADERGSEEYNQKLTQRRLDSVIHYVSKKGFDVDRIVGKSYGKTKPLIKNAHTEQEHKLNRRTTFRLFNLKEENKLASVVDYPLADNTPEERENMLIFKVQVGAYRNPIEYPKTFFASLISVVPQFPLTYFFDTDGLYKYSFGDIKTIEEARKVADLLLKTGEECYIAAYFEGRRITVSEAQAIVKHNKGRGR